MGRDGIKARRDNTNIKTRILFETKSNSMKFHELHKRGRLPDIRVPFWRADDGKGLI